MAFYKRKRIPLDFLFLSVSIHTYTCTPHSEEEVYRVLPQPRIKLGLCIGRRCHRSQLIFYWRTIERALPNAVNIYYGLVGMLSLPGFRPTHTKSRARISKVEWNIVEWAPRFTEFQSHSGGLKICILRSKLIIINRIRNKK